MKLFLKFQVSLLLCFVLMFSFGCKKEEVYDPPKKITNDSIPNTDSAQFTLDSVRLNQLQYIGSHNSYRLKTYQPIYDFVQSISGLLPASLNPDGWDYTHPPLDVQFSDYGVRKIELDIYYDPDGGRFADRAGNQLVGDPVESNIPALDQPGLKVIHIADLDYETNYYTFIVALEAVKQWSDANPQHFPIFILIEAKESGAGAVPFISTAEVLPFDATAMNEIDNEIKSVFGNNLEGVLTPDEVRGSYTTLREAVTTEGWPKLAEARGKVVFLFNNGGSSKNAYLAGHPSLQGRIMFVDSGDDEDESAFIMSNNPFETEIEDWVSQGFLIRTRSDSDTEEARTGDVSKRDRAFASGAQIISTDYYRPDPRYQTSSDWTDYSVTFPGGAVARINPINGPENFDEPVVE